MEAELDSMEPGYRISVRSILWSLGIESRHIGGISWNLDIEFSVDPLDSMERRCRISVDQ